MVSHFSVLDTAAPLDYFVVRMVLRRSGMMLAVGIGAGTVLAPFATSSLLYGMSASDPFSFAASYSLK